MHKFTRQDISEMGKPDVVELLEAHGIDNPSGNLFELQSLLLRVMFVGD